MMLDFDERLLMRIGMRRDDWVYCKTKHKYFSINGVNEYRGITLICRDQISWIVGFLLIRGGVILWMLRLSVSVKKIALLNLITLRL